MPAEVRLSDDACLHLSGQLDRAAVSALWPQLEKLRHRAQHLCMDGITHLDSAGLALLSTLACDGLTVRGTATGLQELTAAYRLQDSLVLSSPSAPSA